MNNVLRARGLVKSYDDGRVELKVIENVDLTVVAGERVSIFGRSGSGKSTLLHLLAGLMDVDAGEVWIGENNLTAAKPAERSNIRNHHMGFVYQFHHLLPEFTAVENVAMPLLLRRERKSIALDRAGEILHEVGVHDRAHHLPHQLSGGEKLRVAVSRAMVTKPSIVLADEPTGNLDHRNAVQLMELMQRMSEESGSAFVVATHDEDVKKYMPNVLRLEDGALSKVDY